VPLAALGSWVRGLRAPGPRADVQYDAQNLPAVLAQDGAWYGTTFGYSGVAAAGTVYRITP